MRHPLREWRLARRCGHEPWAALALVSGDCWRSIRLRLTRKHREPPGALLLQLDLERRQERTERRQAMRERRRQALDRNPAAQVEAVLAEAELDAHFALVDEQDAAIAELDTLAVAQEWREDDPKPGEAEA